MNPAIFNIVIMLLYFVNAIWWLYNRNFPQALYWLAAFQITAAVTWGLK